MSDRLGRRPAILLGLGVTAVSYLVFAWADSLWLLFLSRFFGMTASYEADVCIVSLDVKPYMTEFAPRGDVRQPAWSHELMRDYW